MRLHVDFCFSQGAGFVGTQHIHRAQILNGTLPFDNHLLAGHTDGPARQGHGHHHR